MRVFAAVFEPVIDTVVVIDTDADPVMEALKVAELVSVAADVADTCGEDVTCGVPVVGGVAVPVRVAAGERVPVEAEVPVRVPGGVWVGDKLLLEDVEGDPVGDGVAEQPGGGTELTEPTYTRIVPVVVTKLCWDDVSAAQHPTKLPWVGETFG